MSVIGKLKKAFGIGTSISATGKPPPAQAVITATAGGSTFKMEIFGIGGGIDMANVKASWAANAASEQVTGYNLYEDGTKITAVPIAALELIVPDVVGTHSFAVSALNLLGEGPQSDPVSITVPAGVPSKVTGVSVTVTLT